MLRRERLVGAHRAVLRRLVELSPRVGESRLGVFWAEPFGESWASRVVDAFEEPVRIGLGPDPTTAYAAARYTKSVLEVRPREARSFLDRSPITVLELSERVRRALASLGIRRVGELRAFDPTSLAMRLGPEVADAWHRADGDDPRGPRFTRPHDPEEAELEVEEAVEDRATLIRLLEPMVKTLAHRARDRDRAIVELRLRLDGSSSGAESRRVKDSHTRARNRHRSGTEITLRSGAPTTDPEALVRGLEIKLHALDRVGSVRRIFLHGSSVAHPRASGSLLGPSPAGLRSAVVQRLRDSLGKDAVRRATALDSSNWSSSARWVEPNVEVVARSPWPWRRPAQPVKVHGRSVRIGGRRRRIVGLGRRQRISRPWWDGASFPTTEVCAWAELEGPMLVLLREVGGGWEVIGWLD